MKIGIICAMEEELSSIIHELGLEIQALRYNNLTLYIAKYYSHELCFVLSGIGKVNAALYTQCVIDKFEPDRIINVGVAGGLSEDLDFGDVVIANDLVQHDVDVTAFNIPVGQIPRMDVFSFNCDSKLVTLASTIIPDGFKIKVGRIASGDQFVHEKQRSIWIRQTFAASAVEMEGAAIAHVCYINKIPFLVVRSLSDRAGLDNQEAVHSFDELKDMVSKRSSYVVKKILDCYGV